MLRVLNCRILNAIMLALHTFYMKSLDNHIIVQLIFFDNFIQEVVIFVPYSMGALLLIIPSLQFAQLLY